MVAAILFLLVPVAEFYTLLVLFQKGLIALFSEIPQLTVSLLNRLRRIFLLSKALK